MELMTSRGELKMTILALCYAVLLLCRIVKGDSSETIESDSDEEDELPMMKYPVIILRGTPPYVTDNDAGGAAMEEEEEEMLIQSSVEFSQDSGGIIHMYIPNTSTMTGPSTTSSEVVTVVDESTSRSSESEFDDAGSSDSDGNDTNGDKNDQEKEKETTGTVLPPGGYPDYPIVSSARTCYNMQQLGLERSGCSCRKEPPVLFEIPDYLTRNAEPGQLRSSKRGRGECGALCVCWLVTVACVIAGIAYRVSSRRTSFRCRWRL